MRYLHRDWKLVVLATALIALGGFGLAQRSAQAQNPLSGWAEREDYQVENSKTVSFNTRATVLRNGSFADAEEEQKFTDYYNLSLFPNITHKDNRQSPRDDVVSKLRKDLNACDHPQGNQDVFNKLTDLTLAYMTRIAADRDNHFHPAVRVNAMLAIGEVNSPKAAKVLLDTAFGPGHAFPLRVAAMTGLVRMAGPGGRGVLASPEIEPLVLKHMVPFLKFHPSKKDDGISWMRGQAADVLGELGSAAGDVPQNLLIMLNDKDLPIPLRTKAAKALGKLKYGGNLPTPAGPYLTALAEFAHDALSSEQPANRARVRLVTRDVLEGVKPFASSSSQNDHALIDVLQKTLTALTKDTDAAMTPDELKTSVASAEEKLDGVVKKKS